MSDVFDEMEVTRVGEHVERYDGVDGPIFQCTVCGTNYAPTRLVGGCDPHGIGAAENAFECHPPEVLEA